MLRCGGKTGKMMATVQNSALEKLRAGKLALGFGVYHLRSSATAMIARTTGCDWLFIDTEHGAFTVHEASQICFAAIPTGIAAFVRVCKGALDEGTRSLDNGALGVVVPHVNTATEARRIVEAFRFPPKGHRSWGAPPAALGYHGADLRAAMATLNDAIALVAMIETPEAVANADEIAAVEGIDVLLFGTTDLTVDCRAGRAPARSCCSARMMPQHLPRSAACRSGNARLGGA